jgi:hypothetical protein
MEEEEEEEEQPVETKKKKQKKPTTKPQQIMKRPAARKSKQGSQNRGRQVQRLPQVIFFSGFGLNGLMMCLMMSYDN